LGGLVTLMVLPFVTFAADERTCTMRDAALPSSTITYVLCEEGLLLVTNNEGATWAQRKIPGVDGLRAVSFADENHGIAIGLSGVIVATDDAGKTWQKRQSGTTENLTDIQMVADEGWIGGYDGVLLYTADRGKTWTKQESGVSLSIEALYFQDAKNGWAVGWAGLVLHTTDGGRKWQVVKVPGASWSLTSIVFPNAKDGWISGFAGQLFRTSDGGVTWAAKATPYSGWLTSVAFDGANRGWITTDDGFLLSTDGGQTWKLQAGDSQFFLNKLLRGEGITWALGPFGLVKQTGKGTEWKRIVNPLSANAEAEGTAKADTKPDPK
jgi:photosystem II stability/assembly factor-like uncharacterized protein